MPRQRLVQQLRGVGPLSVSVPMPCISLLRSRSYRGRPGPAATVRGRGVRLHCWMVFEGSLVWWLLPVGLACFSAALMIGWRSMPFISPMGFITFITSTSDAELRRKTAVLAAKR